MKDKEKGDGVDGFGSDKEWEEKEENTVEIVESDEVSYETQEGQIGPCLQTEVVPCI